MARICFLLPSHWAAAHGGAEYQAHVLAQHLHRTTNHEVVYLARRVPTDLKSASYQLVRFGGLIHQRYGFFWDSVSLYRKLTELKPDLIIQRVACAYTGIAAQYAQRKKSTLVWHISSDRDVANPPSLATDGVPGTIDALLFKFGAMNAAGVIAQTHTQAALFRKLYGRNPTAVVPNFHDLPLNKPFKVRQFTVLWIANLKRLKRPEIFLDLARELERYNIRFKVIGRRDLSSWCDRIIERIQHSQNVDYLGELEIDDVNAQLEEAHLLVATSQFEGMPNTFIQAWMREVPTVTLDIDPDGVISKHNLGFRARDFDALKHKVLYFYETREELQSAGKRARDFASEEYSMKNASVLTKILEELLADTNSSNER